MRLRPQTSSDHVVTCSRAACLSVSSKTLPAPTSSFFPPGTCERAVRATGDGSSGVSSLERGIDSCGEGTADQFATTLYCLYVENTPPSNSYRHDAAAVVVSCILLFESFIVQHMCQVLRPLSSTACCIIRSRFCDELSLAWHEPRCT